MGTHFVLERRVMKSFFVIAVALANVALAQDGCPEHPPCPPPPACAEGEMMCQNETPPTNTCALQMCPGDCPPPPECPTFHCLASTTKSATSADCPNFCMMPPCQSGAMCPDTYDSNGCLMPPTCSPNIAPCGEFPSWEQVVKACPKSQYDSYGCEVNPECGPNEMMCTSASYDSTSSCPPKGYCMPATSPNPAKPGLRCSNPEPLLGMGAPWYTTPCARVTCQSGAPWEWVRTDATWASPAGNQASVQQPTCLGQKCTQLPQPACEVTEVYYSVNKNSSKPLLLKISLVVLLNCHSNLFHFDFEREINKQVLLFWH